MTALLADFFILHAAKPILARSASQALDLCRQSAFDLLVLDLDISDIDTLAILQFLSSRQRRGLSRLTIALASCATNNELTSRVRALHIPLLTKPFDLKDLGDLCTRLLSVTDVRSLINA